MLAPSYGIGTSMSDPICATHQGLAEAYDFFNERLFAGRLPRCLVTMHRPRGAYGYFPGKWFSRRVGEEVTDEIALSPAHFRRQKTGESLLTLAREMCHHGQYHFGIPRANLMKTIGLIPTKTRVSGGNPGRGADHYIAPGGPFALACAELVKSGFVVRYAELWSDERARKTKYVCPVCGLCAWGKPAIELLCGGCNERMEGEEKKGADRTRGRRGPRLGGTRESWARRWAAVPHMELDPSRSAAHESGLGNRSHLTHGSQV